MKVVNCTKCNEEYAIDLNKPEEWYCPYCDNLYSLSTDKLEDHLMPYSKEMIQKIRDEKMQLVTAEEFVKLHQEKLAAVRDNDKLQEQLNTAKNFFKDILDVNPSFYGGNSVRHLHNCVRVMRISADKALAALEGVEDE